MAEWCKRVNGQAIAAAFLVIGLAMSRQPRLSYWFKHHLTYYKSKFINRNILTKPDSRWLWQSHDLAGYTTRSPIATRVNDDFWLNIFPNINEADYVNVTSLRAQGLKSLDLILEKDSWQEWLQLLSINLSKETASDQVYFPVGEGLVLMVRYGIEEALKANGYYFESKDHRGSVWINMTYYEN